MYGWSRPNHHVTIPSQQDHEEFYNQGREKPLVGIPAEKFRFPPDLFTQEANQDLASQEFGGVFLERRADSYHSLLLPEADSQCHHDEREDHAYLFVPELSSHSNYSKNAGGPHPYEANTIGNASTDAGHDIQGDTATFNAAHSAKDSSSSFSPISFFSSPRHFEGAKSSSSSGATDWYAEERGLNGRIGSQTFKLDTSTIDAAKAHVPKSKGKRKSPITLKRSPGDEKVKRQKRESCPGVNKTKLQIWKRGESEASEVSAGSGFLEEGFRVGKWEKREEALLVHLVFCFMSHELKEISQIARRCGILRSNRSIDKKLKRMLAFDKWRNREISALRKDLAAVIVKQGLADLSFQQRKMIENVRKQFEKMDIVSFEPFWKTPSTLFQTR